MKCLIVLRNTQGMIEEEKELISVVKKYYEVDVVDVVNMMENQMGFTASKYLAIITSGGDGTVLKTLSICTKKHTPIKNAKYIDYKLDKGWGVWIDKMERDNLFIRHDTLVPVIFAFDCGVRGRLCSLKKQEYAKGHGLLIELLESIKRDNFALIDGFYANNTIRRMRFIVNDSVHVLNEIYIYPKGKGLLGGLDVYIGAKIMHKNIRCDGIVVSTSAGSSGYNASAGGPILYSGMSEVVLTAVATADKKVSSVVINLEGHEIVIKNAIKDQDVHGMIDGCMQMSASEFTIKYSRQGAVYFADPSPEKECSDFLSVI